MYATIISLPILTNGIRTLFMVKYQLNHNNLSKVKPQNSALPWKQNYQLLQLT